MNRVVADRYVIVGELGRGGMGVVWRADDRVIGRQVALKEIQVPPGGMERVLREARTAGRLNDPGVVTVYDVLTDRGSTFVVMELVEAPTLADIMAAQGPLDSDRVANIGLALLSALEVAHAAGIVHRDVKPSNVMLLPGDRVKLADFGIARAMDDPGHTSSGVLGSPGYMAPELFNGGFPGPASDLWALGATMFHAVEGHGPFHRDTTAATLHAIMYEEPRLQLCRRPLADVIMGLLVADPYQRWLPAQVRQVLSGGPPLTPTRPVDPWEGEPKPGRRKAFLIGGAAAAAVAVAATSAVLLANSGQQDGVASAAAVNSTTATTTAAPTTTTTAATTTTTTTTTTTSKTTTTKTKPPLALVVLTRYHSPVGFHFSGTPKVATPSGFTAEGPLGSLLSKAEPGSVKFYACKMKTTDDHFSSVDQTGKCEGQTTVALLGYVFKDKPDGVVSTPLYRCNAGNSHFDSVIANCESPKVVKEGTLGYVVSADG
ncbi:serine/threonine-protein kinase [Kutzneria sp. CA-103260]|uniref:serine/threonine-protein kinase n=1 Tax=Kutzneria sp. CA-103260 TaxID=2802641 RepID=UPI001BF07DC7|nr:Serine/threonine-protein kinase PknD [Kutzneria sp. CA-103260]